MHLLVAAAAAAVDGAQRRRAQMMVGMVMLQVGGGIVAAVALYEASGRTAEQRRHVLRLERAPFCGIEWGGSDENESKCRVPNIREPTEGLDEHNIKACTNKYYGNINTIFEEKKNAK